MTTSPPVSLLTYLYRLPLARTQRLAIMDMVARLSTEDRLRIESEVFFQWEKVGDAVQEALRLQDDASAGDDDALWDRFLLSVMRERIAADETGSERIQEMRPVTPVEHRKHKDEQKARMLQSLGSGGAMPDQNIWRAVTLVVDRGHKAIDANTIHSTSFDDLSQKESWLTGAYEYFVRDQSHILRDLTAIIADELTRAQDTTLLQYFDTIGVASADYLAMLRNLEEGVTIDLAHIASTVEARIQQYHLLKSIRHHDHNARFSHLAHAFIESLRVLFDGLGAFGMVWTEQETRRDEELFAQACRVHLTQSEQAQFPIELTALADLYRGVYELTRVLHVADGGASGMLDYERWDAIQAKIAAQCQQIETQLASKNTISSREYSDHLNGMFAAFHDELSHEDDRHLADDELLARLIYVGDAFRVSASAAMKPKGRGFTIASDDHRFLVDASSEAIDAWRTRVQEAAVQFEAQTQEIEEISYGGDAQLSDTLSALMETVGFVVSVDEGWEDELSMRLREHFDVLRKAKGISRKLVDAAVLLHHAYFMKPLARIFEETDERWGSSYPFIAFPLAERKEKFRQLSSVYNLVTASLMEKKVTLPMGELAKETVERVRTLVGGVEALAHTLSHLEQQIYSYINLEQILQEQETSLSLEDLTKGVFVAYNQKNFKKLKESLENGDINAEQAKALSDAMVRTARAGHGVAAAVLGELTARPVESFHEETL